MGSEIHTADMSNAVLIEGWICRARWPATALVNSSLMREALTALEIAFSKLCEVRGERLNVQDEGGH